MCCKYSIILYGNVTALSSPNSSTSCGSRGTHSDALAATPKEVGSHLQKDVWQRVYGHLAPGDDAGQAAGRLDP